MNYPIQIPLGFQAKLSACMAPDFGEEPYTRWPLRRYIKTCWSVQPRANRSMEGLYATSRGSTGWWSVFSLNSSRVAGPSILCQLWSLTRFVPDCSKFVNLVDYFHHEYLMECSLRYCMEGRVISEEATRNAPSVSRYAKRNKSYTVLLLC